MPESLSAPAPAKVNLALEVLGRRADGYHEIDTILQTIELADTVTITFDHEASEVSCVTVGGPCADGCPADRSNLAWRAAEWTAAQTGGSVAGVSIQLEKQIPAAGGLGGGASDAATVLRLLQRRDPDISDVLLLEAANAVGSDEAFFLTGGTARARGRGDRVEPLAPLPSHGVVLFVPTVTIERKTARMFAALDEVPDAPGDAAARFADGDHSLDLGVVNAFDRVADRLFPVLGQLRSEIERRIGRRVSLAGAGPTLFWIGPLAERDAVVAGTAGLDCAVIPTMTVGPTWLG